MKTATKVAIATLSSVLLFGSSVNFAAEASSKPVQKTVSKKAAKSSKAIPAEDKVFIENEMKRIKELHEKTGDMYILFHKYKELNNGLDISYWGGVNQYNTYKDYMNKASALEGAIIQEPSNLPKGYKFSKAIIEGPTNKGKIVDEVKAEGKKSGKPIYFKKIDWKEPQKIRLEYTNGKHTIALTKYMLESKDAKKKGFFEDDFPKHIYPKYLFWHDDKNEYSISTTFDMSKKQRTDILKAAVKK